MKVLSLIVCLLALAGCAVYGPSESRANAEQWADAVSMGDFATARDLMRVDMEIVYASWRNRTSKMLAADRLGAPHVISEMVRGATRNYCVQWGSGTRMLHDGGLLTKPITDYGERPILPATIFTDSAGKFVVADWYDQGACPDIVQENKQCHWKHVRGLYLTLCPHA